MKRIMLTMAVMALAMALSAGVALAANIDCAVAGNPCLGTNNDDTITGTANAENINTRAGDDVVDAGGSANGTADEVKGGPDDDTIDGEGGDDVLRGNNGADTLEDTTFDTPDDVDELYGGNQRDVLTAVDGDANDVLDGGPGANDICDGEAGDVFLNCELITTF